MSIIKEGLMVFKRFILLIIIFYIYFAESGVRSSNHSIKSSIWSSEGTIDSKKSWDRSGGKSPLIYLGDFQFHQIRFRNQTDSNQEFPGFTGSQFRGHFGELSGEEFSLNFTLLLGRGLFVKPKGGGFYEKILLTFFFWGEVSTEQLSPSRLAREVPL